MKKIHLFYLALALSFITCEKKGNFTDASLEESLASKGKSFLNKDGLSGLYYWAMGKKISLTIDSSTMIVQWFSSDSSSLKAAFKSQISIKPIKENLFAVKSPDNLLESQLSESIISKATSISPSYKIANMPLIPTGELVLMPKSNTTIETILSKYAGKMELVKRKKYNRFALKAKDFKESINLANQIYESGLVEWCYPDFIVKIQYFSNDTYFPNQYYLNQSNNIDINAPQAWDLLGNLNCPVRVAVIDDGVESHPDLAPLAAGYGSITSSSAHGEAVTGILAAKKDNSIGIAGVASNATIVPVSLAQATTLQDIADAINWAWEEENGKADILNCSWGSAYSDDIVTAISLARTNGRGGTKGAIVVCASGNDNPNGVAFPANIEGVITVGAVDRNGTIAAYSSRGPEMDLVAPSSGTTGDVYTIDRAGLNGYNSGDYVTDFGGTSAACPQVSGVAALMLTANPSLTETQVRTILQTTATDMGTPGFDNTYGYGRVNAEAAVRAARPSISGPDLICNSGTYSINNMLTGVTATWSSSPSYSITSLNANNSQVLVTKLANNQDAVLSASFNSDCGPVTLTKEIAIGAIDTMSINYSTGTDVGLALHDCASLKISTDPNYPQVYLGYVDFISPTSGPITWTLVNTSGAAGLSLTELSYGHYRIFIRKRGASVTYDITMSNACGSHTRRVTFYANTPCP